MCTVRKWDLSYETLRSFDIQEALRHLRDTNAPFWQELTAPRTHDAKLNVGDNVVEDLDQIESDVENEDLDDSDISVKTVLRVAHQGELSTRRQGHISKHKNGGLTTISAAERLDELPVAEVEGNTEEVDARGAGRGKRKKTANRLYSLSDFAPHWDNEGSDIE